MPFSANLSLTDTDPAAVNAEALVIGLIETPDGPRLAPAATGIDPGGRLAETLTMLGASGKAEEVTKLPSAGNAAAPLLVAAGLGEAPETGHTYAAEALRRAAGAAVRTLAGTGHVALGLPVTDAVSVGAVAEGAQLGAYSYSRYQDSDAARPRPVKDITVITSQAGDEEVTQACERARVVGQAVALARDLVNTPPSDLHPAEFAGVAQETGTQAGVGVEVLDESALDTGGYGGILGVGQGSVHPPRLVRLTHTHPGATRTIAYVGKGITFDSGGLSLKPAASMEWMKSDMGGAAAVLAAISAVAHLGLPVNVVGYLALAENMPSGTAQRPSDVLTIYGGKTVEVLNTDAEGRLVMADAIVRAAEDCTTIVDVATLTGAQITALGNRVAGAMANDEELRRAIVDAAGRAGDGIWPMPLPDELRRSLDSSVADIANTTGDRSGSMLQAGLFLREFVPEGIRWAHLDIAGPAFNQGEPHGYTPKGGTGAATRTLLAVAEDAAAGRL